MNLKKDRPKIYTFVVTIGASFFFGIPLSIFWNYLPQAFPFVVAWMIVHPVYKIWRELGDF